MNIENNESHSQKANKIMNQRLIGLINYLKVSAFFSQYNDNNNEKNKNLENFFKNKIFKKRNPNSIFSINRNKYSNLSEEKKKNMPLDYVIKFRKGEITIQTNKFSSPYDLHSKKNNFLKNIVKFSKDMHSESRVEKDLKENYPLIESFSFRKNKNNNKKFNPKTPKFSKRKIFNKTNFSPIKKKNISLYNNNNKSNMSKITNIKNYFSINNRKNNKEVQNLKNGYFKRNLSNDEIFFNSFFQRFYKKGLNKKVKYFRANCYYNKLYLKKISKKLVKNTYLDLD